MTVQFRLKELVAKKERKERRKITYQDIVNEAKVSIDVVNKMSTGRTRAVRVDTLEKLCYWLNCQPGDLIVLE